MKNIDKRIERYVILPVLVMIGVLFSFAKNVFGDTAVSAQIPICQIGKTDDTCSYLLTSEESSAPVPEISRIILKGNEERTVDVLCATTGVWHYVIQSENPNSSPTKYHITIQVIENNGRLAAVTECYDDNGYKTTPVFKIGKPATRITSSPGSSKAQTSKRNGPPRAKARSQSVILKTNPKTGDTFAFYGYFMIFLISGAIIVMAVIKKKRKN